MSALEQLADGLVIPSRSRYQIEHFVVSSHDTPHMQYRQILIEAQALMFQIRTAEISQKRLRIEIDRLLSSADELDLLEAEEKTLAFEYNELALEGARKELSVFQDLFERYPTYSIQEIEENQPEYWKRRLIRQAEIDRASIEQGVSPGNLQSLLSAGIVSQKPEVEQ